MIVQLAKGNFGFDFPIANTRVILMRFYCAFLGGLMFSLLFYFVPTINVPLLILITTLQTVSIGMYLYLTNPNEPDGDE